MTPAQYNVLKVELQTDPQALGYSAFLPNIEGKVEALLNAKTFTQIAPRMVTARAILAECAGGAVILDKLEAFAPNSSTIKWAVIFLKQDAGIDVGNAATQGMITQLVQGSVLTTGEGASLKALASIPCSRAEVLGLGVVTSSNITGALFNDDGSVK